MELLEEMMAWDMLPDLQTFSGLMEHFVGCEERTERVLFDVADFGTAYNTILGRPTMAQFMAVVHYAYRAIKIPGPIGSITVVGNAKTARHCDKRSLDMVELTLKSQPETAEPSERPVKVQIIASTDDRRKAVSLDDTNPTKTVQIGASLDPK
ncbi:uncharacterized protein LOC133910617 [Phragmites australis]|uniref:uncharacterized protein LOC133910617 n=1 Tax=Phragmites australis TaxID=29695 RepID=UPI002D7887E8|nr:uncharacterized protein LOC133910617 [Phragmites australis]